MLSNILVVDDAHVERVLVKGLLENNPKYRVDLAADGKQGKKKKRQSRHKSAKGYRPNRPSTGTKD